LHTTSVLGDLKKYPELKQKYKQMIKRLKKKPHLLFIRKGGHH